MTGALAKTTDDGLTWTPLPAPDTNLVAYTIYFTTDNDGFSGGSGSSIYRTTDGGISWMPIPSPGQGYRSFFFSPGSTVGYACGFSGTIGETFDFRLCIAWPLVDIPGVAAGLSSGRVYFGVGAQF